MVVLVERGSWLHFDWTAVAALASVISALASVALLFLAITQLREAVRQFGATQEAMRRQASAAEHALRSQVRPEIVLKWHPKGSGDGPLSSRLPFRRAERSVVLQNIGLGPARGVQLDLWPVQGHVSVRNEAFFESLGPAPVRSHPLGIGVSESQHPALERLGEWPVNTSAFVWRATFSDVTGLGELITTVGQVLSPSALTTAVIIPRAGGLPEGDRRGEGDG